MNGSKNNQSAVYEFAFPSKFETDLKDWLQPELFWQFSDVIYSVLKYLDVFACPMEIL